MKNAGKRFLSLLVCMCMIFTFIPDIALTVDAASSGTVSGWTNENIGLSYAGTANDDPWTYTGTTIVGSVKSTSGCNVTSYESTLKITNRRDISAALSFDYEIVLSGGSIKLNGQDITESDKFSQDLDPGQTVDIYIKSGSTSDDTKITLYNISLSADITATTTFIPAENGSYTVDNETVSETFTKTRTALESYVLKAEPADGYQFAGWYNETISQYIGTDTILKLNVESDCTITAKFVSENTGLFETGGQIFEKLQDAISYAENNNISQVSLHSRYATLEDDCTIPENIVVLIPFDEDKTLFTKEPSATADSGNVSTKENEYSRLTLAENTTLIIKGGMSIGGRYKAARGSASGYITGDYGQLWLSDTSSVVVENGGSLYAWGFASGQGNVTVESGGTVYEWYQVADFRGGSATIGMKNKVFPFSQYFVQNIESQLILKQGAIENAYAAIYANNKINTSEIPFVCDNGMFKIDSGCLTRQYDGTTDRIVYTVNGAAEVNNLALKLAGSTVNSKKYILPLTNNMTIDLSENSSLTINQSTALLAGVVTDIAENAQLIIDKDAVVYVYDSDEWLKDKYTCNEKFYSVGYAPSKEYNRQENDLKDAKININGKLTVNGALYTTDSGADITSSNATGHFEQVSNIGKEDVTYQYTQSGSTVTEHEIPITPAKLHNSDGTYTETSAAEAGTIFNYTNGTWQIAKEECTHEHTEWRIKEATCTEKGAKIEYCTDCNEPTGKMKEIPALGHDMSTEWATDVEYHWHKCSRCDYISEKAPHSSSTEATEDNSKVCDICGYVMQAAYGHVHKKHLTLMKAKEPTCTEAGIKTSYYECTCGKWFSDDNALQEIEDHNSVLLTAKGHTEVIDKAIEATCTMPGKTEGKHCSVCNEVILAQNEIPARGHKLIKHEGKQPTYAEAGWKAYETCENCDYSTYESIPALGEPSITSFEEFLSNLQILENCANEYAKANPGKDPLALVIKYIRTGVERYNSGSWGIMAGYEDTGFANYVKNYENEVNTKADSASKYIKVTGLKNLKDFTLPNGNEVDFGHMFGTIDISYNNKGSVNHADVGGWAGDLVDLMSAADLAYNNSPDSLVHLDMPDDMETMVNQIREQIFLKTTCEEDKFSETDFYGDMDALYIIQTLYNTDYQAGTLTQIIQNYCTESLNDVARAEFFVKNRLGTSGTRTYMRESVYNEYAGNKTVSTLESTRNFIGTDAAYINKLRKAACYAFADYICQLAGDYTDVSENPYYTDFDSEISTLAPGVIQEIRHATTADDKQMVYYLATADLSNRYVTVKANYNNCDPSTWAMTRVLDQANAAQSKYGDSKSDDYITNYKVVAAVNADGFNMSTGEPMGLLVMDGKEYHAVNSSGFFGIQNNGKAVIGTTEEYNNIYRSQLRDAVGGFGTTLVKNGNIAVTRDDAYYSSRASRTAVGITKTGKVVLMVLDGRQEPVSCGGSMQEIAQIMLEAGCVDAINLDGGGSTTFVSKPEGSNSLEITNRPSDGYARSVSSTLMIVSTAPSSTAFDHARLDTEYDHATVGTNVKITPIGVSATGNIAELPDGYTWSVSDDKVGKISADGVFTGLTLGDVDVILWNNETEIGRTTMHVVEPTSIYFTKTNLNVVYGATVDMPIAALYNGKNVAINDSDIKFTVDPEAVGTCEKFRFHAASQSDIRVAAITASLKNNTDIKGILTLNLYRQGESTFDFDSATGGNRQLAWLREISNATTEDKLNYTVIDRDKPMQTSYVFAMDMTQIPIPEKLNDLVYMLPGADANNASAWNFLLQLAERVSVLTEVTPVLQFDSRFDVDYSDLNVVTEYFEINKEKTKFDSNTNTLRLVLNWKNQTQPIDAEKADPLCMVSGIKLTPKADAYSNNERITAINKVDISYKIYLRANALYSFAQKKENQTQYGLLPFENPNVIVGGTTEKGGYFAEDYISVQDSYTISRALKQGWIREDNGYAYYNDGTRLNGIQKIDGYYYDFGDYGINVGQTRYTGIMKDNSGERYIRNGIEATSGWNLVDDTMYHSHSDGYAWKTSASGKITCVKGGRLTYTCQKCGETHTAGDYTMPNGHIWNDKHICKVCGYAGKDINDAMKINFGKITEPRTSTTIPRYYYLTGGVRPGTYITFDGKTALTQSNDANLNPDGTMRDVYVSWTNNQGIGKAYVEMQGKGNYYGSYRLEYHIIPNDVKNLTVTSNESKDGATLTWSAANGADYYRLYYYKDGTRTFIANTENTSYALDGLTKGETYSFQVASSAYSTDGEKKVYNCAQWSNTATLALTDSSDTGDTTSGGNSTGSGSSNGGSSNRGNGSSEVGSGDTGNGGKVIGSGSVVVAIKPDGTKEIIKNAVVAEDGKIYGVDKNRKVEIIDNSKEFSDTIDHWSREEVNFVAARELFNGVGHNLFGIHEKMTRGMVNTVLARLAGEDTAGGEKWYTKGTEWAINNGISDGTSPESAVTREQLVTMLYRYSGSPESRGELTFADAGEISSYARNAMYWAVQNGIIKGVGNNCIAPKAFAERSQVAAMMARYIKMMAK